MMMMEVMEDLFLVLFFFCFFEISNFPICEFVSSSLLSINVVFFSFLFYF